MIVWFPVNGTGSWAEVNGISMPGIESSFCSLSVVRLGFRKLWVSFVCLIFKMSSAFAGKFFPLPCVEDLKNLIMVLDAFSRLSLFFIFSISSFAVDDCDV